MVRECAELFVASVLVASLGCGGGGSGPAEGIDVDVSNQEAGDAGTAADAGTDVDNKAIGQAVLAHDRAFYAQFTGAAESLAGPGIPSDESGLLGRNRTWGDLYSPRFQLGAGFSLRVALAAERPDFGERAFRAIEVGFRDIEADGRLPSRVPDEVAQGAQPTPADVASAAAFFLSDACVALLALEAVENVDDYATSARREAVLSNVSRSLAWLATTTADLEQIDATAPNRLFHNAVAFRACGTLVGDPSYFGVADRFRDLATDQFDQAGNYVEGGGADTNYQAVAVQVGLELSIVGDDSTTLAEQLELGTTWLAARVTADGRIDSTGNTRTCGGCETFLPGDPPKQVAPSHVIRAMGCGGLKFEDSAVVEATERFIDWLATATDTSCFEQNGSGELVPTSCTM